MDTKAMTIEVKVVVKNVYGERRIYPVDFIGKKLCELCGTKTITEHMIDVLKEMNYSFSVVPESI